MIEVSCDRCKRIIPGARPFSIVMRAEDEQYFLIADPDGGASFEVCKDCYAAYKDVTKKFMVSMLAGVS